jgi:ribosomal protein L11 methyltransferase
VTWTTLRVHPGADRDAALAAMFDAGVQGVQEDGDLLVTCVPPGADVRALSAAISGASAGASVESSPLASVDWAEEWKKGIHAHVVGPLVVAPPWLAGEYDPTRSVIIDPAMAFGTGEHPTTRGVLRLLPSVLRGGDRVADLGAGSAVLAIAAARLGAGRVAAIELDPDAIGNAEANVARNGAGDHVTVIEGDAMDLLPLLAPVDVVLANIISSVLLALLPVIRTALGVHGRALLSGLLLSERDDMLAALTRGAWLVTGEDTEENWWTVAITPA